MHYEARSLRIDGLECPNCSATMVVIALITKTDVIAKILDHLRIPSTPPPVAPPRRLSEPDQADLPGYNQDPEDVQAVNDQSTASAYARPPP